MRWDRAAVWRILKGSGASSGATALALVCHLASVMLIARLVEKEVFGTYLVVLAAAQGVKVLGGLGLDTTLTRHLAGAPPQAQPAAFGCVVLLRVLGLLAACVLVLVAGARLSWFDASLPAYSGYLAVIAIVGSCRELLLAALQGMLAFGRYAYGVALPAGLRLAGVGLLYATGRGELVDLLRLEIAVLGVALLATLALSPIRRLLHGWMTERGLVGDLVGRLLRFSASLYANSILYFLSGRLNLFLLAALTGAVQVANYGAAWQVPDGFARILSALVVAYFPFAARLAGEADHRGAARLTEFALALVACGTTLAFVVAALFGPGILSALFGAVYRPAAVVFALLMASCSLQSLVNVMGYALVAAGHPGVTARINVVGLAVLLAGGLVAIPALGAPGAAAALVGANGVVLALNWRAMARRGLHADGTTFLLPLALGLVALGLGHSLAGTSIAGRLTICAAYLLVCGAVLKELRASIRFFASEGLLLLRRLRAVPSRAPRS